MPTYDITIYDISILLLSAGVCYTFMPSIPSYAAGVITAFIYGVCGH